MVDIELWCRSHGLKLNADKSDDIWLGIRQQLVMINQADKDCDSVSVVDKRSC